MGTITGFYCNEFYKLESIIISPLKVPLGGMIGAITSSYLADYMGRKGSLMAANGLVVIVGALNIMAKYVNSYEVLILGKFIAGITYVFYGRGIWMCQKFINNVFVSVLNQLRLHLNKK